MSIGLKMQIDNKNFVVLNEDNIFRGIRFYNFLQIHGKIFPVWIRNRSISGGLEPVLSHIINKIVLQTIFREI